MTLTYASVPDLLWSSKLGGYQAVTRYMWTDEEGHETSPEEAWGQLANETAALWVAS